MKEVKQRNSDGRRETTVLEYTRGANEVPQQKCCRMGRKRSRAPVRLSRYDISPVFKTPIVG